ncbi:MarR family winged helix-turn-helix transcriptional regulator [Sphingosinicella rhizophila]|uniref:MarR family transcriptional regulator n=1 Tax=Sphingosinicella rhizophila TaxID=3050082 RepID=A0ABU3Q6Y7_9SPHN|nr:MarR family transcriptional regulator [Sphingosinicella sp. GR2756]MDT9599097.1 MarR family transcriptional regulator [Sphingosinicella sp. GR2756]
MQDEIASAALKAIRRILRASEQNTRKLAAATRLTPSQLLVLKEIDQRSETTPGAIAAALQFSQPTVTNILDRLEELGLVLRQRSERDRRQMLLRISPSGKGTLDAAPDPLQERFRQEFSALLPWEQAMMLAGLERLGQLLDASEIDAAPLIDTGAIDRNVG